MLHNLNTDLGNRYTQLFFQVQTKEGGSLLNIKYEAYLQTQAGQNNNRSLF